MFAIERYQKAESIAHAVGLLAADPGARIIAGGTDILIRLRDGSRDHDNLVDIHDLSALKGITEEADGTVRIGAMATFSEIMDSETVRKRVPLIAEAVSTIGGPQLRNMATMGGNICAGVPCADSAGALLVLEADLEIEGVKGRRMTPVAGFHLGPGQVALAHGDLLVAFHIRPENFRDFGAAYYKYAMRDAMDIATIGCAAAVRLSDDRFDELRLAFSVAAPTPVRCGQAEKNAKGRPVSEATLEAVCEAVENDVAPRTSWRATREFRMHLIRTLTGRIIRQAVKRAGGTI